MALGLAALGAVTAAVGTRDEGHGEVIVAGGDAAPKEVRAPAVVVQRTDPVGEGRRASSVDAVETSAAAPALPRPPSVRQQQLADGLLGVYREWDESWVHDNFRAGKNAVHLEEKLEWMRPRLGVCEEPGVMHVGDDSFARFLYPCEKGTLEAAFKVDPETGKAKGLLSGARDVEPDAAVRRAAEGALRLVDSWDRPAFDRLFNESFDAEGMERFFEQVRTERGTCALEGVDLAGPRGALWFLQCESGPALMKTEIDDEDQIYVFWINPRRKLRPVP